MIDNYQYYPTPKALSELAWETFKNRQFVRVLEPSAGEGHLLKSRHATRWTPIPVDCIEIDIAKHPALRQQGFEVVGMDFMQFQSGSHYSHVIMNPPFAEGVKHVLKAWDLVFDAEIVAILNAETLKNPYSKERQYLLSLIEQYGEVTYLREMFTGADALRKTEVEIALVWLKKSSGFEEHILGDILAELSRDKTTDDSLAAEFEALNPLMLPNAFIDNAVLMFKAAVESARQAVISEARAMRYAQMMGKTLAQMQGEAGHSHQDASVDWVKKTLYSRYVSLKDRAWAGVLRSTQVTSRLSSAAQKRLEADFETIKSLEFSVANIYGFLQGILNQQNDIQMAMACDVFDLITRYHSDNTVFYMGWKSNDRHRRLGMRIKTTRFVIPGHKTESYSSDLSWSSCQLLADIDKVFAMLDGKVAADIPLDQAFSKHFNALRNGNRIKATYFELRYYPGVGTIHFFPTHKDLIDRLNRVVGRHRRWLPPAETQAGSGFWQQYDQAEKFDKAFLKEVKQQCQDISKSYRVDPFWAAKHGDEVEQQKAGELLRKGMSHVLLQNGIDPDAVLENPAADDTARLPMPTDSLNPMGCPAGLLALEALS